MVHGPDELLVGRQLLMNRDRPLLRDAVELGKYIMPHCDAQGSFLLKQPSVADFERVNLFFLSAGGSLERVGDIYADVKQLFGFQGTSCNELLESLPIKKIHRDERLISLRVS